MRVAYGPSLQRYLPDKVARRHLAFNSNEVLLIVDYPTIQQIIVLRTLFRLNYYIVSFHRQ